VTTVEDATATPVTLGRARGGPNVSTLRTDRWWVSPAITVTVLTAFVAYTTWAIFVNKDYYVGAAMHRDIISPLYSPCIMGSCVAGAHGTSFVINWWHITPALIILLGPLPFRLTCYYYRRAYYRSYWLSPPACAVADAHSSYSGESRFPLILQNLHRYFFFVAAFFNVILTIDAVEAFRLPGDGGFGVSVGTLVLVANAALLWLYSLSCHAARHMCGGNVKVFSAHPVRQKAWRLLSRLNAKHMQFAWISLVVVALTDLYVRLVASGTFTDPKIF